MFEEILVIKNQIERDIVETFYDTRVTQAIEAVGNNCIIDFAWLGAGRVIVIELNPFGE